MISYISGKIKEINNQNIVLEVNNLGFSVFIPNESTYQLNQEIALEIYLHWTQENGPQLFGFQDKLEKEIFCLIISCSGIGPKLALQILSKINKKDFINAVILSDIKLLSSINGIGSKKAELLIMQLKDKINKLIQNNDFANNNLNNEDLFIKKIKDLSEVLNSLNYSKQEINLALEAIKKDSNTINYTFDQLLKKALNSLLKNN